MQQTKNTVVLPLGLLQRPRLITGSPYATLFTARHSRARFRGQYSAPTLSAAHSSNGSDSLAGPTVIMAAVDQVTQNLKITHDDKRPDSL